LDGVRIETKQAAQIVSMMCEGLVFALLAVDWCVQETVMRVLATAGEQCARLLDEKAAGKGRAN